MKFYWLDRMEPLEIFDDFTKFATVPSKTEFAATCLSEEEFVFQLILLTEREGEEIEVTTSLVQNGKTLAGRTASFVTEGIDKWGKPFVKTLKLTKKEYQPLYIGVNTAGITGNASVLVTIKGDSIYPVLVRLNILFEKADRMGDLEPKSLSRLKWLGSTEALNDAASKSYTKVGIAGKSLRFLGREVTVSESGLPLSAASFFEQNLCISKEKQADYLSSAVQFSADGEVFAYNDLELKNQGDNAQISASWDSGKLQVALTAEVKYEGAFYYRLAVVAKEDYAGELKLDIPFAKDASRYGNGLTSVGGYFKDVRFRWNPMHQDSMYVGDVNAGIRVKWKAEEYMRPLINVYYKAQPLVIPASTWANNGEGGVNALKQDDKVSVTAYTGTYTLAKGETRYFDFEVHFTPFESLDKEKMFGVRYYHNNHFGNIEKEIKVAKAHGLNYIIIHHGNEVHPFINYPFIETEYMEKLIRLAHAEGIRVKFYYTLRESSNHMAEIFAYKAMASEIVMRKKFGGYGWMAGGNPWLKKYFGEDIVSAWRVRFRKGKHKGDEDAAFIVRPDSRLDNYYIEGLKFLTEVFHIDGIYIDDTSLDRTTLERARKVLDRTGGLIDMHMWNHEEERAGMVSCMNLYTEIFPFVDSVWIGEGYDINKLSEDYLLTEVSGLPYGKPGQMLEGGGNPFAGMLYGMNNRYGWGCYNADRIYRLWDSFRIEAAEMRGYWDKKNKFSASDADVKVTSYERDGKILLAVYNFSFAKKTFQLNGTEGYSVSIPKLKALQGGKKKPDVADLKLKPRDGRFFLLKKNENG